MTRIAVMARAPVAGQAKTRLAPRLGAEGAAALARRLLQHAVAQAVQARLGQVTLWCTPDLAHPAFVDAQREHGVALALQHAPGGSGIDDLGVRMAHVFATSFAELATPLLLMGTDIPGLTAQVLQHAAQALRQHDAVFVPTLDGGYALVGLRVPVPSLFSDMRWSTPEVMAQTRQRISAAGLRHAELPPLVDIDEPADLVHLPMDWGPPQAI